MWKTNRILISTKIVAETRLATNPGDLLREGMNVSSSNDKINARIRDHEVMKVPVMLVVGEKEREARSVALRRHGKGNVGVVPLDELFTMLKAECAIPE